MQKKSKILFAMLCCVIFRVNAQVSEQVFRALDVEKKAQELLGDSAAFPILLAVANHNPMTNIFSLSPKAQAQVQYYRSVHRKVRESKTRLDHAINNGAKVFTTAQLDSLLTALHLYENAMAGGKLQQLPQLANTVHQKSLILEQEIEKERKEPVDALIAKKDGTVDKRKGFLGQWKTAFLGDYLVAYDGVRTYKQSTALISFTDGVDVFVDTSTTVIIRESHRDRLYQSMKKDIALVNGSVLARMEEKAKEKNDLYLQTNDAESSVKSGLFWANVENKNKSSLSNYDGTIAVTAQNQQVQLGRNEGTIVLKGKPPMVPIPLLPAPQLPWRKPDSVLYQSALEISWNAVREASRYEVEISAARTFDQNFQRFVSTAPRAHLKNIPQGVSYLRIVAFDKNGLRGLESQTYTLVRVLDTQPPAINFEQWDSDTIYTAQNTLTLHGITESNSRVWINSAELQVDEQGEFASPVNVQKPETRLRVTAIDASGNEATRLLRIIPMDSSKAFQLQWSCKMIGSTLLTIGKTVEVHGNAYPNVRVYVLYGSQTDVVTTDYRGAWEHAFTPIIGDTVTIKFESIKDRMNFGSHSWEVK